MALPREFRLRRSVEVRRVLDQGRTRVSSLAAFYWLCRKDTAKPRVAVIVSRRVGKATVRNRVRRRMGEILRRQLAKIRCPADMVIVSRRRSADATYQELERQLRVLLQRAGLLEERPGPEEACPR